MHTVAPSPAWIVAGPVVERVRWELERLRAGRELEGLVTGTCAALIELGQGVGVVAGCPSLWLILPLVPSLRVNKRKPFLAVPPEMSEFAASMALHRVPIAIECWTVPLRCWYATCTATAHHSSPKTTTHLPSTARPSTAPRPSTAWPSTAHRSSTTHPVSKTTSLASTPTSSTPSRGYTVQCIHLHGKTREIVRVRAEIHVSVTVVPVTGLGIEHGEIL